MHVLAALALLALQPSLSVAPARVVASGTTVKLTARAVLPKGAQLRIVAGKSRRVAACRRSPCTGSYRAEAGTVRFRAVVTTGASVVATSRTVAVRWAGPAAGVVPGHYEGRTSQNEVFRFDISADGSGLTNLQIGQINENCLGTDGSRPPLFRGHLGPLPDVFPVSAAGGFAFTDQGPVEIGGLDGYDKLAVTGRVAGGTATGTLRDDATFSIFTCTSGDQSWTAVLAADSVLP